MDASLRATVSIPVVVPVWDITSADFQDRIWRELTISEVRFCRRGRNSLDTAWNVPEWINLEREEMYGEFFDVPEPDELVFSGQLWRR